MGGVSVVQFAELAKTMAFSARGNGWQTPAFRSPPPSGRKRSIRQVESGVVISIALKNRGFFEVVVDMIDGYVLANQLSGEGAAHCRAELLESVVALEQKHAA